MRKVVSKKNPRRSEDFFNAVLTRVWRFPVGAGNDILFCLSPRPLCRGRHTQS